MMEQLLLKENSPMVEILVCPHSGEECYFWDGAMCLLEGTGERCEY